MLSRRCNIFMRDLTLVFRKERDDKKIWRQKCVPCSSRTRRDHLKLSNGKIRNHTQVGYESRSSRAVSVIATRWSKMGRGQAFNIRAVPDLRSSELFTQSA